MICTLLVPLLVPFSPSLFSSSPSSSPLDKTKLLSLQDDGKEDIGIEGVWGRRVITNSSGKGRWVERG